MIYKKEITVGEKKKTKVGIKVRTFFVAVWVVISTIVYGILCLVLRIFGEKISRWITVLWCKHVACVSGVRMEVAGLEKLDRKKNYLFIANHQSYYDIIALFVSLPYKLSFVARKNLFSIPFFGWGIRATGHIPIDRSNPAKARKSIEKACHMIESQKRSIFGFPEGTRSATGEVADFKLGLFGLAIKAGIDIVPIAIQGARDVMARDRLLVTPGVIHLRVAEPIRASEYGNDQKFQLAGKARETILSMLDRTSN